MNVRSATSRFERFPPGQIGARTILPAKRANEREMSSRFFPVVSRVSRAILVLLCLPGFAGVPFVGAPEPAKPTKESPLTAEEQLATFTVPPGFKVELVAAEPDGGNQLDLEPGRDGEGGELFLSGQGGFFGRLRRLGRTDKWHSRKTGETQQNQNCPRNTRNDGKEPTAHFAFIRAFGG